MADPSLDKCRAGVNVLVGLLRELGFQISWNKVVDPCQVITFLGVELDSVCMTMRLPEVKLREFHRDIVDFACKTRASKKQLQSLAGKLNWACQVVRGGRTFLRRVLDDLGALKQSSHKRILSAEFYADLAWWKAYLGTFNGVHMLRNMAPIHDVHVDACNKACGAFFRGDWVYCSFKEDWPEAQGLHINHKEVLSLLVAARRWAPLWSNSPVVLHTDSMSAKGVINKGSCRNPVVMKAIRELFWLSASFNFTIRAVFVPGKLNDIPDAISRIHQRGQIHRLFRLLGVENPCLSMFSPYSNMSFKAFVSVFQQVKIWLASGVT